MEIQSNKRVKHTDPISDLPQPIIHHIISLLPNDDVKMNLMLLSKTWYHNFTLSPYLDFDDHPYRYFSSSHAEKEIDKYVKFVTKSLQRFLIHNLQIKRLTIPISFHPRVVSDLDTWVGLALKHGVEELNLKIKMRNFVGICLLKHGNYSYDLPPDVFYSKSIKVANFVGCSLLNSFPKDRFCHTNLLKLCLDRVVLNELGLRCIISSCPLIEDLSIVSCTGIKGVRISNLHKLKTLRINNIRVDNIRIGTRPGTVEIDAPSLQSLILERIDVVTLECPKLSHLELDGAVEFDLEVILSRFPLLRSLYLSSMNWSSKFKVSSHTLRDLKVVFCNCLKELDTPNLLYLIYKGGFDSLASLTHNVTCRWDVSIWYTTHFKVENFFVQLRNFVSKVKHLDNLYVAFGQEIRVDEIPFEEQNERTFHPVGNVDHLELWIWYPKHECFPALVLEAFLLSCHPRTLSLKFPRNVSLSLTESLDEVIACHRHCCSCTLLEASVGSTYLYDERWR